jgi:sortase (surface protein transpeptidase)
MSNRMPAKRGRGRILLATGVVVAAAAAAAVLAAPTLLHQAAGRRPEAPAASAAPATSGALVPSRLRIPAIGVDSRVESVGITSAGTMGVPTDVHNVGWYALGVHPGQAGDAVIDGHLAWSTGPAVFAKLNQVKAGDVIEVGFSDGTTHRFRVQHTGSYPWNDRPPQLFTMGGAPRLSLVTCSGTWDGKAYSQRVVVDAALAD